VARTQAIQARSAVAKLRGCSDLSQAIDTLIDQIDRLADALASAESAMNRCDEAGIKDSTATLSRIPNPAARDMLPRLNAAAKDCAQRKRDKDVADARESCRRSFGANSVPVPATIGRDVRCQCAQGYTWTADEKSCVSEAQAAAERNERCRQDHGNSYHAGPPQRDGTFYCIPDRQTADALCRKQYGDGVKAGQINADGSANCIVDVALGNSLCQREFGPGSYALSRNANGTFQCFIPARGQPQQQHDVRASAAIIEAIGAAASAIQGARRNPPPPQQRCHHRPGASTQHCGSN
jgi:hypothetical protein